MWLSWASLVLGCVNVTLTAVMLYTVRQLRRVEDKAEVIKEEVEHGETEEHPRREAGGGGGETVSGRSR